MSNPVAALISWLKHYDSEQQYEIAFLICTIHPGTFDTDIFDQEKTLANLYNMLESSASGTHKDLGYIISFRAIFDFLFTEKRGSKEGWDRTVCLFDSVINDPNPSENRPASMVQHAQEMKDKLPERMTIWFDICDSWKKLKESDLSDASLERWHDAYIFSEIKFFKTNV